MRSIYFITLCFCIIQAIIPSGNNKSWSDSCSTIGTKYNWTQAECWSPSGVPSQNDTITIDVSGADITINSNVSLSSLFVNSGNLKVQSESVSFANEGSLYVGGKVNFWEFSYRYKVVLSHG